MMRKRTVLLGALLILLCSCSSRFFRSASKVRDQLTDNLQAYTTAADSWGHQPVGLTFYYLSDGHYRWGDSFIDKTDSGYKIGKSGGDGTAIPDLATAATQAGTDENTLKQWIATAQQLKIYSVHKTPTNYVEIQLWGADKTPYGLRYAPDDVAENALLDEVSTSKRGADNVLVLKVKAHWYYFE